MTIELEMLVYSTVLLLILTMVQSTSGAQAQGLAAMIGPRDDLPPPKVFQARMKRVVDNHREGLTIFAPLVLALAAAHVSSRWSVLGTELFFGSRVVHAIAYITAAPVIRPLAYFVGLIGIAMLIVTLFCAI